MVERHRVHLAVLLHHDDGAEGRVRQILGDAVAEIGDRNIARADEGKSPSGEGGEVVAVEPDLGCLAAGQGHVGILAGIDVDRHAVDRQLDCLQVLGTGEPGAKHDRGEHRGGKSHSHVMSLQPVH